MTPTTIGIRLIKPVSGKTIEYSADVVQHTANHIVVRAVWRTEMGTVDLGTITFAPGDYLYEHFYADRWYNVFELHAADGRLKGWYCNITRPAVFHQTPAPLIESEDLALDIIVPPDRANIEVLDEDEYAALGLDVNEPLAHVSVQAALIELRTLARQGAAPFRLIDADTRRA